MTGTRALVAMSGGVDSSVAALQMLEAGYDCIGVTMKLYDPKDLGLCSAGTCGALDDAEDAKAVANRLGMEHQVLDFSHRFREAVIDPFVRAYETGATPNPCVDCNRQLKFGQLLAQARDLERDIIATGHYARVFWDEDRQRWLLLRALDRTKDQSYVLWTLTQEQLAHTRFPLGELTKDQVRSMAEAKGFDNAQKHDSQDICFVPDGDYAQFICKTTGQTYPAGEFVDQQGTVLGRHRGIIHYTVGQRKGLGIALGWPAYVGAIDPARNQVVLCRDADLFQRTVIAEAVNLIGVSSLEAPLRVTAKIRYRHQEQPAEAVVLPSGHLQVTFDEPQRAITRGQSVVLYQGNEVLGGGIILRGED